MKKLLLLGVVFVSFIKPMENVGKEIIVAGSIVGTSIAAASLYGILNDQVTARICPEYFTEGFHKDMMRRWNGPILGRAKKVLDNTKSPTVIGLIWGPIATWWVGAALGVPAMLAARIGSHNQLNTADLIKPLAVTLAVTGAGAAFAGTVGYFKAKDAKFRNQFANNYFRAVSGVPENAMHGFITDAYAHQAAYGVGALSGLGLIGYIIHKRVNS